MHDPILENPLNPSMEPWLTALFGPGSETAPAPGLICELVKAIDHPEPHLVAAVALATVASAVGPKFHLHRGRSRMPIGFNVVVSHDAPRSLPWFDVVTAPLVGRVFEMQARLARRGAKGIVDDNAKQAQQLNQARRTVDPNPELLAILEAEGKRGPARLKPFVATSDIALKELGRVLPQSFDHGVVVVAAGNDPGADLLRLKSTERAQVAEVINRSWSNTPLAFGQSVEGGQISLLWQTRCPVKDLLKRGFDGGLTVPVLFLKDTTPAKAVPEFEHEAEWNRVLKALFDFRCLGQESIFTLAPAANAALSQFEEHIDHYIEEVPAMVRPYVVWLPELAARLAALFWVLLDNADTAISAGVAADAVATTRWLGRSHLAAVSGAILPDAAAETDRSAQMLAKIRVRQPITRRQLWCSFDRPKTAWFEPALAGLLSTEKVSYTNDDHLVAK